MPLALGDDSDCRLLFAQRRLIFIITRFPSAFLRRRTNITQIDNILLYYTVLKRITTIGHLPTPFVLNNSQIF